MNVIIPLHSCRVIAERLMRHLLHLPERLNHLTFVIAPLSHGDIVRFALHCPLERSSASSVPLATRVHPSNSFPLLQSKGDSPHPSIRSASVVECHRS